MAKPSRAKPSRSKGNSDRLQDLKNYEDRWKALDTTMTALGEHYSYLPDFPRKQSVLYLLKSLQAFGAGQFNFFYDGFDTGSRAKKGKRAKLESSERFPPPYLLNSILVQIGYDLEVVQRIADQRISASPKIREVLEKADKLAWDAIKPAIDYGVAKEATTTLTYFQKSTDIRVIPYAQMALIGIPFSCLDNKQDFLAIPHEVGHYVFRHPTPDAKKIRDDLQALIERFEEPYHTLLDNWFEETFADIYGCLIAGPIIALDFQDISLQHSKLDFVKGDDDHPTPILRPYIYTKVLRNE